MTQTEAITVAELAKGTPQRAIAAQTGMSQPTVCRINNKHKELIQTEQAKLIEKTLTKIADRTIREIEHVNTLSNDDLMSATNQQALARIDKKEDAILKATGINASHAPSIHIQQIFNDNSTTLISPEVTDLLGDKLNSIIEADYEEIPSDNE
jgi:hypothetical protein